MMKNSFFNKINIKQLVLTITLLFFLMNSSKDVYIQLPVSIICLAALIFPDFKLLKITWLCLILIFSIGNTFHYFELDNHKFLYIYWCIAIFACLFSDNFENDLKINAKLLIGFVFAFASLWKIISGDYLNNSFFVFTSITDGRIAGFFGLLHLLSKETIMQNRNAVNYLVNESQPPYQIGLLYTSGIYRIAQFLTYFGLLIEIIISVLFLLPDKISVTKYRDYALIVFLFFTYLVAPVWEFGSILSIIGLAQTDSKKKSAIYVLLFLIMQIYRIHIGRFLFL
jgi:hypothetical protein